MLHDLEIISFCFSATHELKSVGLMKEKCC